MKGTRAKFSLLVISLVIAILLILKILSVKIGLLVFAAALALLGLISNSFKRK